MRPMSAYRLPSPCCTKAKKVLSSLNNHNNDNFYGIIHAQTDSRSPYKTVTIVTAPNTVNAKSI